MLVDSVIEKNMWGEAVQAAVYLLNRSPTSCIQNITPAELWYKVKPDVGKLRIFGCLAFQLILKEKGSKFTVKCKDIILVRYAVNGNLRVFVATSLALKWWLLMKIWNHLKDLKRTTVEVL